MNAPHGIRRTYRKLTSTLTIVEATPQDNGTYVCTASNREGITSDDTTINVLGKVGVEIVNSLTISAMKCAKSNC